MAVALFDLQMARYHKLTSFVQGHNIPANGSSISPFLIVPHQHNLPRKKGLYIPQKMQGEDVLSIGIAKLCSDALGKFLHCLNRPENILFIKLRDTE